MWKNFANPTLQLGDAADHKRATLLPSLNEESYKLLRNLCKRTSTSKEIFDEYIKILTDVFSPVKAIFSKRLMF